MPHPQAPTDPEMRLYRVFTRFRDERAPAALSVSSRLAKKAYVAIDLFVY